MKKISCPLCGSTKFEIFRKLKNKDNTSSKLMPYKFISVCNDCGLIYQNPCLPRKDMEFIYQRQADKITSSDSRFTPQELIDKKRIAKIIKILKPPKKILEIGCSEGSFLAAMAQKSYQAWGIDPSKGNFEKFKKGGFKKNIHFIRNFFEKVKLKEKFDFIFHHYVLEHSYQPKEFLKKARTLCKKEGMMILEVPDVRTFISFPFATDLFSYQHICHFYQETLTNLLSLTGWKQLNKINLGLPRRKYGFILAVKPCLTQIKFKNYCNLSKKLLTIYFKKINLKQKQTKKKLNKIIKKLIRKKARKLVIFGAGTTGQFIYEAIKTSPLKIWFCDNDNNLHGKKVNCIKVLPPGELKELNFDFIIIASIEYQEDIFFQLKKMNIAEKKIISFYGQENN